MHYHHICAARQQLEAYETAILKIICRVVHIVFTLRPVKCVGVQPTVRTVHCLNLGQYVRGGVGRGKKVAVGINAAVRL